MKKILFLMFVSAILLMGVVVAGNTIVNTKKIAIPILDKETNTVTIQEQSVQGYINPNPKKFRTVNGIRMITVGGKTTIIDTDGTTTVVQKTAEGGIIRKQEKLVSVPIGSRNRGRQIPTTVENVYAREDIDLLQKCVISASSLDVIHACMQGTQSMTAKEVIGKDIGKEVGKTPGSGSQLIVLG